MKTKLEIEKLEKEAKFKWADVFNMRLFWPAILRTGMMFCLATVCGLIATYGFDIKFIVGFHVGCGLWLGYVMLDLIYFTGKTNGRIEGFKQGLDLGHFLTLEAMIPLFKNQAKDIQEVRDKFEKDAKESDWWKEGGKPPWA